MNNLYDFSQNGQVSSWERCVKIGRPVQWPAILKMSKVTGTKECFHASQIKKNKVNTTANMNESFDN